MCLLSLRALLAFIVFLSAVGHVYPKHRVRLVEEPSVSSFKYLLAVVVLKTGVLGKCASFFDARIDSVHINVG